MIEKKFREHGGNLPRQESTPGHAKIVAAAHHHARRKSGFERNRAEVLKWMNHLLSSKSGPGGDRGGHQESFGEVFPPSPEQGEDGPGQLDQASPVCRSSRPFACTPSRTAARYRPSSTTSNSLAARSVTGKPFHYSVEKGVATLQQKRSAELSPYTQRLLRDPSDQVSTGNR